METALPLFHLGRGTSVCILLVGQLVERPGAKGADIPFQYRFEHRGRLSRYQVKKRMARWFCNALRSAVHEQDPTRYRRRVANDLKWARQHARSST